MSKLKDIEKLHNISSEYKYKCKCGHSVINYPFEHKEYKICSWCGYRVYKDEKEQKRHDFNLKIKEILMR